MIDDRLPDDAERLAEDPRVGRPDGVGLLRQTEQQHEQVGDGQVEEAVVGGRGVQRGWWSCACIGYVL